MAVKGEGGRQRAEAIQKLAEAIREVPATETYEGRTTLLIGIECARNLNRVSINADSDLKGLINQLITQDVGGSSLLFIFVDNAIHTAGGETKRGQLIEEAYRGLLRELDGGETNGTASNDVALRYGVPGVPYDLKEEANPTRGYLAVAWLRLDNGKNEEKTRRAFFRRCAALYRILGRGFEGSANVSIYRRSDQVTLFSKAPQESKRKHEALASLHLALGYLLDTEEFQVAISLRWVECNGWVTPMLRRDIKGHTNKRSKDKELTEVAAAMGAAKRGHEDAATTTKLNKGYIVKEVRFCDLNAERTSTLGSNVPPHSHKFRSPPYARYSSMFFSSNYNLPLRKEFAKMTASALGALQKGGLIVCLFEVIATTSMQILLLQGLALDSKIRLPIFYDVLVIYSLTLLVALITGFVSLSLVGAFSVTRILPVLERYHFKQDRDMLERASIRLRAALGRRDWRGVARETGTFRSLFWMFFLVRKRNWVKKSEAYSRKFVFVLAAVPAILGWGLYILAGVFARKWILYRWPLNETMALWVIVISMISGAAWNVGVFFRVLRVPFEAALPKNSASRNQSFKDDGNRRNNFLRMLDRTNMYRWWVTGTHMAALCYLGFLLRWSFWGRWSDLGSERVWLSASALVGIGALIAARFMAGHSGTKLLGKLVSDYRTTFSYPGILGNEDNGVLQESPQGTAVSFLKMRFDLLREAGEKILLDRAHALNGLNLNRSLFFVTDAYGTILFVDGGKDDFGVYKKQNIHVDELYVDGEKAAKMINRWSRYMACDPESDDQTETADGKDSELNTGKFMAEFIVEFKHATKREAVPCKLTMIVLQSDAALPGYLGIASPIANP